jgi:hypothetical protein
MFYNIINLNEAHRRTGGGFQVENQCLFPIAGS